MNPAMTQDVHAVRARKDDAELNRFVADNKGFILRCASKVCKRFITDSDDEYEIALLAFWEAVRKYDEKAGNFNAFAALVIRRRLIARGEVTAELIR